MSQDDKVKSGGIGDQHQGKANKDSEATVGGMKSVPDKASDADDKKTTDKEIAEDRDSFAKSRDIVSDTIRKEGKF